MIENQKTKTLRDCWGACSHLQTPPASARGLPPSRAPRAGEPGAPPDPPCFCEGAAAPSRSPCWGAWRPPRPAAFMRGGYAPSRSPFKKKIKPSPQPFPHRDPSLRGPIHPPASGPI